MALFGTTLNSMNDLLTEQLQDLYDAEQRITEALPKMAQAANSHELKQAFESHLAETRNHVTRLEQIFQEMGQDAKAKTCPAMKGLLAEGEEMIKADGDPDVKDAALIASAQRVEHYEMAAYGSARAFAQRLGLNQAVQLLTQTLNEEGAADKKLTSIAEQSVNVNAR